MEYGVLPALFIFWGFEEPIKQDNNSAKRRKAQNKTTFKRGSSYGGLLKAIDEIKKEKNLFWKLKKVITIKKVTL